jgi:hypothetical protein
MALEMGSHGLLQAGAGKALHLLELVKGEDEPAPPLHGQPLRQGQHLFLKGQPAPRGGADVEGEGGPSRRIRPHLGAQPSQKIHGEAQEPFRPGFHRPEQRLGHQLQELRGRGGPEDVHIGDERPPELSRSRVIR